MEIKNCLILSAGLGTRMGERGKTLPKVLWPVFNKTLLELQIAYAKEIGCKRIFVNVHHCADQIIGFLKEKSIPGVEVVHEKILLGSGGAIHNIAEIVGREQKNHLLTLNGDHFIFFDQQQLRSSGNITLFGMKVYREDGYNQIEVLDGLFKGVVKNSSAPELFYTYSGISIIRLDKLKQVDGPSSFFKSVANPDDSTVNVRLLDDYEFTDFGTGEHYRNAIEFLKRDQNSIIKKFCIKNGVIIS